MPGPILLPELTFAIPVLAAPELSMPWDRQLHPIPSNASILCWCSDRSWQPAGLPRCPNSSQTNEHLRLQVPTVLIARTDADSATLLTSDIDEVDRQFCTGERTPEGFFKVKSGRGGAPSETLNCKHC